MNSGSSGKLAGKVAIVTGAGQGAGMGAAVAMAAEGASIVLFGRTLSKLEIVETVITDRGGQAVSRAGDVTVETDLQAAIDLALNRFGGLDIVVNAAQSPEIRRAPLLEIEAEAIADLWNSGAAATLALMRLAYPHLKRAGGGSIVNFGSDAILMPQHYGVYAGVKAAIQAISRAAALEWGPDKIRVNMVAPLVKSPAFSADSVDMNEVAKTVPLGYIGDPVMDIGRPIAFLASDESSYITGSTFMLDGGVGYLR